jgi:hypothetical protein
MPRPIRPDPKSDRLRGSGTGVVAAEAVKVPDCDVVMLLPDWKSAAVHVPAGQKYSWIFWGDGIMPLGSGAVKKSEKPPV